MNYITIPCDCKCCLVCFNKTDDEYFNISIVDSYYYNHSGLFQRVKNAFKVLFGKPIYYNDACISKETMQKLVVDLTKLTESN